MFVTLSYHIINRAIRDRIAVSYEIAFATEDGAWDARTNHYAINRLTVSPTWTSADFAKQLRVIHLDGRSLESIN